VVTRYTIRGTHQGETEDFGPPTSKQMELKGITIHRFEGAKIVEEWERYDNLSVLHQLGLAPNNSKPIVGYLPGRDMQASVFLLGSIHQPHRTIEVVFSEVRIQHAA
jgi:hypothetical protein